MMRFARTVICAFFTASLAYSPCMAADSEAAALQMVKKLRLGGNLAPMGLQAATGTVTYQVVVKTVGADNARALVTQELNKVRPKYQDQRDRNLAASYAPFFTSDELLSIAEKQRQSPYINKFLSKQNDVGAAMRSKSTQLPTQYVTEAMTAAYLKVAPK
jgi:hypothetical protein